MPPKDKKGTQIKFKTGTLAKDIIPAHIKNVPREGRPLRKAEIIAETKTKFY